MRSTPFTEAVVVQAALAWLEPIGWQLPRGPDNAPDIPAAKRQDCGEVELVQCLRDVRPHAHIRAEISVKDAGCVTGER